MRLAINGIEVDLTITLGDAYRGRRNGFDVGDFTSGVPSDIAANPLAALEAIQKLKGDELTRAGVDDFETFLATLEPQQVDELVAAVRDEIGFFFPAMRRIAAEFEGAIDDAIDEARAATSDQSGSTSGKPPESSASSHGDSPTQS